MAIRKYTKWIDKCGANPKGIRITPSASAFVRTVCSCGFADVAQVYECPCCGNTEFVVCESYNTTINTFPMELIVSKGTIKVIQKCQTVYLRKDIEIDEETKTLFEYDGTNVRFSGYNSEGSVFEILEKNKDKLPEEIVDALETTESFDGYQKSRVFSRLLDSHPKADIFIKMEKDKHPAFVKAVIVMAFSSYNSIKDIDFTSVDGFFREYGVPTEFQEFIDKYPSEILNRTLYKRWCGWRSTTNYKFETPQNWEKVPTEIKSVARYYLDNGVISFDTYLSLASINEDLLCKKKNILNLFFKKYMMQFKNSIVNRIEQVYRYLDDNKIPINETTFDEKWVNQKRNMDFFYDNLSRSHADIDAFINCCDTDAVTAIKNLAASKRTKKTKTSV